MVKYTVSDFLIATGRESIYPDVGFFGADGLAGASRAEIDSRKKALSHGRSN